MAGKDEISFIQVEKRLHPLAWLAETLYISLLAGQDAGTTIYPST